MEEIPESRVPPETVTRKTIEDYLKIQGLDAITPEEVERLASIAVKFQLNPFLRELHILATTEKGHRRHVAVVGYEVYLKKAERTGKLDGWKSWTVGEGQDLKAVLEIYRHDWTHPFQHEVHYSEAVQTDAQGNPTPFWLRMPRFLLRKTCIAQGFRHCFAEELGGFPFDPNELSLPEPDSKANHVAASLASKTEMAQESPTVFTELGAYLEQNAGMFTAKHLKWIKDQLEKSPTAEQAKKMLGYSKRVVMQGGDPPDLGRSPRAYGNRGSRRPEAVPEPTF